MNRHIISIFLTLLLTCLVAGCSGDSEKKPSSAIDRLTDKVAQEAVDNIRELIERAKQVQALQEAHTKAINEAVNNQ